LRSAERGYVDINGKSKVRSKKITLLGASKLLGQQKQRWSDGLKM
jgi:hypothetical protein